MKVKWKWHQEGALLLIEGIDNIIVPRDVCRTLGAALVAWGEEEGLA